MENENAFITGNVEHKKDNFILFISGNKIVSGEKLPKNYFELDEKKFNHDELLKNNIDSFMIAEIHEFSFGGFFGGSNLNLPQISQFKYYDLNHNEIEISEDLKNNLKTYGFKFS